MQADPSQKDNHCDFVSHRREGLFLMNTRVIANPGDRVELGIRAKYIPGAGETEVNYTEALFKDIPEELLFMEPGAKQEIQVAGLGAVEVEAKYLDHIPPLFFRPQETLDPNPNEFRIVAPVLVRDNEVIVNGGDGSSINTGSPDATLMLFGPGEGRYLISLTPLMAPWRAQCISDKSLFRWRVITICCLRPCRSRSQNMCGSSASLTLSHLNEWCARPTLAMTVRCSWFAA